MTSAEAVPQNSPEPVVTQAEVPTAAEGRVLTPLEGLLGTPRREPSRQDPELDAPGLDLRARLAILSGRFAWDGTRMVITHAPTLSRLTDRTMSASTMHSLDGCPSRWAFEKLWPGAPDPFAASVVGNGAHTVLERFYSRPAGDRTMSAAMAIDRQVAEEAFPGDDALVVAVRDQWMAEVYVGFKGIFDIEDPARVDVVAVEQEIRTEIAGVGFVGYVDRLERNGDGLPIVVDYKSGSLPKNITQWGDTHGDQQRLYLLALERITGEMPTAAYLHYTRLGQTKKVAQSRKRLAESRDRFVMAAERLALIGDTAAMRPVPSPLCGWCPLVSACPAARAEGKVDRTDKAVPADWLPIPVIGPPAGLATGAAHASHAGERTDESESTGAAHMAGAGPEPEGPEAASTASKNPASENRGSEREGVPVSRLKEGQPYVELADGDLNPNSYASMAAVDVVEMAVHALDEAGVPLSRSGVVALAGMYTSIILGVQSSITGSASWQEGMNSRARFLVKRILRNLPTPLSAETVEEWDAWAAKVGKRARLMWTVAYGLWSDGVTDDPAAEVFEALSIAKQRLTFTPRTAEPDRDPTTSAFDRGSPVNGSGPSRADREIETVTRFDIEIDTDSESGVAQGTPGRAEAAEPHDGATRNTNSADMDGAFGDFPL